MVTIRRVFLSMVLFSLAAHGEDIPKLLQEGDQHYVQLQTVDALRCYEKADSLSPGKSETLIRLARAYSDIGWLHWQDGTSAEGYYVRSVAIADTLVKLYPNMAAAHFWCALTTGSLIPFRSTREKIHIGKIVRFQAEKAIELDSTFSYAYIILAIFERELAKLSWFEKTIARIVFGEDLHGSFARSEELLYQALKYDSTSSYAFFELSLTYDAMGRKEESITALDRVIALPISSQREERQRENAQKLRTHLQASL
jgi:tetratricopeptide (TPR) repeat protein